MEGSSRSRFRIALLVSDYSHIQKEIVTGFRRQLRKILPVGINFDIETFCSEGFYVSVHEHNVRTIIQSKFDLILTVGLSATKTAKRVTKELKSKIPVIFTGVSNPQRDDLIRSYGRSYNNLVGISVESPCRILPAQVLLAAKPNSKRFFLPYRRTPVLDYLEYEFEQMQELFAQFGRTITLRPITEDRLTPEFFAEMEGYDGVLIPEGGLTSFDKDAIVSSCDARGILVHADGKDAIKNGAVFATRSDLRFVGKLSADYAKRILVEGVKPSKLESRKLRYVRSFVYDFRNANKHGISFSSDILYLFEAATASGKPIPQYEQVFKEFASYCQTDTPFSSDMITRLTEKIRTQVTHETGRVFSDMPGQAIVEKKDQPSLTQRIDALVSRPYVQKLYVGGGDAAAETLRQMKEKQMWRNLESIQVAASLSKAQGLSHAMQDDSEHFATVVEPLKPDAVFMGLKTFMKRCEVAFNIVGLEKDELPQGYDEYIASIEASARDMNVNLKTIVTTDIDEIAKLIRKRSAARNGFFAIPHLIRRELVEPILNVCLEQGVMFCAPSLTYAGRAPLAIGVRERSFDANDIPYREIGGNVKVRKIDSSRAYTFCADNRLIKSFGGVIPARKTGLLAYKCVILDEKNADEKLRNLI